MQASASAIESPPMFRGCDCPAAKWVTAFPSWCLISFLLECGWPSTPFRKTVRPTQYATRRDKTRNGDGKNVRAGGASEEEWPDLETIGPSNPPQLPRDQTPVPRRVPAVFCRLQRPEAA